jgi:hypothetical protein
MFRYTKEQHIPRSKDMQSKQAIGQTYCIEVLQALTRLGYATTRQLAACIFGRCSLSDRKQISRVVGRLLKRKHVVEKRSAGNNSGERMIALTQAGVRELGKSVELIGGKSHARDWLRHAHAHRTACNSIWASLFHRAGPSWTELEIRSGVAPTALSLYRFRMSDGTVQQKIPDLIVTSKGDPAMAKTVWIEVENAWRGPKDFRKLIDFLRAMFNSGTPLVHQVWLIVTGAGANGIGRRLRTALTHGPESGSSARIKVLDAMILAERVNVFRLNADTLELNRVDF